MVGTVLLAGCRVDTRVSVVERGGGSGSLAVTVTLDRAAVQALGGQSALARQLSYADLESAGWAVAGPHAAAGGGESVTVSHGFSGGAQLSRLMSDVAGSAPGPKPFRMSVSSGGGFFTNRNTIRGAVDLRCGLQCFGDPGLQAALGGSLGVSPQPLEQAAGETAAEAFRFSLALRLPGRPGSVTGSPSVARDGTLTWSAPLGQSTLVGAVSESVDWGHVVLASVLAALVILAGGFGGLRWRRRRRRATLPGEGDPGTDLPGEPANALPGDPLEWPSV